MFLAFGYYVFAYDKYACYNQFEMIFSRAENLDQYSVFFDLPV
jgi:hypothetical protein